MVSWSASLIDAYVKGSYNRGMDNLAANPSSHDGAHLDTPDALQREQFSSRGRKVHVLLGRL